MAARLPLEQLQPYLLDVPHPRRPPLPSGIAALDDPRYQSPLDLAAVFGNDHPIELEAGMGKGLFVTTQATTRPQVNFLGVEIEYKYTLFTASRLARRGLTNARLACTDARWFLRVRTPPASLAAVHVYFPDPWWKLKHRKRKLFTADFATAVAQSLKADGRLYFITDVAEYFEETLALVAAAQRFEPLPVEIGAEVWGGAEYLTNFDRKFRAEGRTIHRAVWRCRVSTL